MAGGDGLGVCEYKSPLPESYGRLTACDSSFLAGALPLSMTLSQSQLRLLSSIGIGILVGTSLIVIIPEGIEAVATSGVAGHSHGARSVGRILGRSPFVAIVGGEGVPTVCTSESDIGRGAFRIESRNVIDNAVEVAKSARDETETKKPPAETPDKGTPSHDEQKHHEEEQIPTFYIGFSLILGFVLMFLIDRLPRHATDSLQSAPQTRHISLEHLGGGGSTSGDEESEGFLGSLAPPPKQSRSLATTTGLVIHAAADGIAMGASTTTSNTKLGFIIFVAIMLHKAPAAFGLTSVLLKQGLSKRAARGHLIVFSLAAPFGALTTWLLITVLGGGNLEGEVGQWWTGMLLLFSAGTFL